MTTVGQRERATQKRVVKLFRDKLGYAYLGDRADREGNSNIEQELLRAWLTKQKIDETLISRAMHVLGTSRGHGTSRGQVHTVGLFFKYAGGQLSGRSNRNGFASFTSQSIIVPIS